MSLLHEEKACPSILAREWKVPFPKPTDINQQKNRLRIEADKRLAAHLCLTARDDKKEKKDDPRSAAHPAHANQVAAHRSMALAKH